MIRTLLRLPVAGVKLIHYYFVMDTSVSLLKLLSLPIFLTACASLAEPLSLHPDNPHYFLYQGKPTIIVTSGEHYGAVLNLDFKYETYLDSLAANKLNGTRTFSGAYVEPPGAFNITQNTLAPLSGRFICPWARSGTTGYPNGGNKFDVNKWDDAYFKRLKDFVAEAQKRGVIVEMNLFCPFYGEEQWKLSPQNAANNVNNIGNVSRTNVYTLDRNGGLLAVHDAMVKKIVTELNSADNLYYEICNEPYFGGVTLDWQHHIADTIVATEKSLSKKHLISRNVQNGAAVVDNPYPAISIFNFHYASPPNTVAMNYKLNKVIGDNETGFRGTNDLPYRVEAWSFLLAGGGLFNNLDYSFTAGHENGDFSYPPSQPGGGNPIYRKELQILRDFIYGFDFIHMKSDAELIKAGVPQGEKGYALSKPGDQYAVYLGHLPEKNQPPKEEHTAELQLGLPDGEYNVEWVDVLSGKSAKKEKATSTTGLLNLRSPPYQNDIALGIRRSR